MTPSVKLVFVGDARCGKSTLLSSLMVRSFVENASSVINPITSKSPLGDICVGNEKPFLTLVDTPSAPARESELLSAIDTADMVIVCFDLSDDESLTRLTEYWLPLIRRRQAEIPVSFLGTKVDLLPDLENDVFVATIAEPLMEAYENVAFVRCCTAKTGEGIDAIDKFLYRATYSLFFPTRPLLKKGSKDDFSPLFDEILDRTFQIFDMDNDNGFNDDEVYFFHRCCFGNSNAKKEEMVAEFAGVINEVENPNNEVRYLDGNLTRVGFKMIFKLLVTSRNKDIAWKMLWFLGYDRSLELRVDCYTPSPPLQEGEKYQLSDNALNFLQRLFMIYSQNREILRREQLDAALTRLPTSLRAPWSQFQFPDCVVTRKQSDGTLGINIKAWTALWSLLMWHNPSHTLKLLQFLGWPAWEAHDDPSPAYVIASAKKDTPDVDTFTCYLFGRSGCGKTSLMRSFVDKPFIQSPRKMTAVARKAASDSIVILVDAAESELKKGSLEKCDLAVFLYDQSDPLTLTHAGNLFKTFDLYNKKMPVIFLGTKSDLMVHAAINAELPSLMEKFNLDLPIAMSSRNGYNVATHLAGAIKQGKGASRHYSALTSWRSLLSLASKFVVSAVTFGALYAIIALIAKGVREGFANLSLSSFGLDDLQPQVLLGWAQSEPKGEVLFEE